MKGEEGSMQREQQVAEDPGDLRSSENVECGKRERRWHGGEGRDQVLLPGRSSEESELYPSETTSNGRLSRAEMGSDLYLRTIILAAAWRMDLRMEKVEGG